MDACRCESTSETETVRFLRVIAENFLDYLAAYAPEVAAQWDMLMKVANGNHAMSLKDSVAAFITASMANRPGGKDFVEYFAGAGNLTRSLLERHLEGSAFDITYDNEAHDVLTPGGLRLYLTALASVRQGGLAWFGTECSSFVVLCLSVTRRHPANNFLGDQGVDCVKRGNALATVSALLFFLSFVTQLRPVLEQPANSCLPDVPAWKFLLHWIQAKCSKTYLGAFEGPSQKPLQLWHCCANFCAIERRRPEMALSSQLVTRDADGRFTGNPMQLAESERYTPAFGKAFADIFCGIR